MFHPKYTGEEQACTVKNLRRSTQYKFRVRSFSSCHCVVFSGLGFFQALQGSFSAPSKTESSNTNLLYTVA